MCFLHQNIQHRKYARWKATYIHNCLKNGETPQAGPIGMEGEEQEGEEGEAGVCEVIVTFRHSVFVTF